MCTVPTVLLSSLQRVVRQKFHFHDPGSDEAGASPSEPMFEELVLAKRWLNFGELDVWREMKALALSPGIGKTSGWISLNSNDQYLRTVSGSFSRNPFICLQRLSGQKRMKCRKKTTLWPAFCVVLGPVLVMHVVQLDTSRLRGLSRTEGPLLPGRKCSDYAQTKDGEIHQAVLCMAYP